MSPDGVGAPTPADAPWAQGLRVANVCRVLWNGGVARAAIEQTEALRALGLDCDLIFLRRTADASYRLPQGTTVLEGADSHEEVSARVLSRSVTRWFAEHRGADASVDIDLLWRVRRRLRPYDVVIFNDQYAGLLGIARRLIGRRPYVQMFHEFYPRESRGAGSRLLRPLADGLDRLAILVAPAIVATSSHVAERIELFAPGRTYLARLAAPTPPERPIPVVDRDRRGVFSVTVWDRGRHPELYLELARSAPEFRFTLAGIWTDPDHLAEFRQAAAGVANLEVTGPISEIRRVDLMNASLLYLRVGFSESGPGMGGLEALSVGSIVVANRGLGLAEILHDGRDGFVVERADPASLAALLRGIDAMSAESLERMSASARSLAQQHSWTAHARVLARAIGRATGRGTLEGGPAGAPAHAGPGPNGGDVPG